MPRKSSVALERVVGNLLRKKGLRQASRIFAAASLIPILKQAQRLSRGKVKSLTPAHQAIVEHEFFREVMTWGKRSCGKMARLNALCDRLAKELVKGTLQEARSTLDLGTVLFVTPDG